jgi:hypothetical protein
MQENLNPDDEEAGVTDQASESDHQGPTNKIREHLCTDPYCVKRARAASATAKLFLRLYRVQNV